MLLPIFQLPELPTESKKNVIRKFNDINMDHDWWEDVYEDFTILCSHLGITIIREGFSFDLDLASSFKGTFDVSVFIENIRKESWKEHAPKLELSFPSFNLDPMFWSLIKSEDITFNAQITSRTKGYDVWVEMNEEYPDSLHFDEVNKHLEHLSKMLTSSAETLNKAFFTLLEDDRDYRISDEAIEATIIANEFWFTSSGTFIPHKDIPAATDKETTKG
jgi:hypothetical protein